MNKNDETIVIDDGQIITPQMNDDVRQNEKGNTPWKQVTIGAASGILLGAGALYAIDTVASDKEDATVPNPQVTGHVKVAKVNEGLSFEDAFAYARAQVGGGGVFRWNGGIYSTYTEDEWSAMTDNEKSAFAYAVRPEVRADEIVAERMKEMTSEDVRQSHEATPHSSSHNVVANSHENLEANGVVSNHSIQQNQDDEDNDVHVVGQGTIHGHQAVAFDITGNGEADVAIIDWNDNGRLDDPDVMIDRDGNYATIGQLAQADYHQDTDNGYASDTNSHLQDPNMQYAGYNSNDDGVLEQNIDDIDAGSGIQDDGGFTAI